MEISEVKSDYVCPTCNITLEFKRRIYSKKQKRLQKEYFERIVNSKLFRYFKIPPKFLSLHFKEAMEMRCPKCQRLYYVGDDE